MVRTKKCMCNRVSNLYTYYLQDYIQIVSPFRLTTDVPAVDHERPMLQQGRELQMKMGKESAKTLELTLVCVCLEQLTLVYVQIKQPFMCVQQGNQHLIYQITVGLYPDHVAILMDYG